MGCEVAPDGLKSSVRPFTAGVGFIAATDLDKTLTRFLYGKKCLFVFGFVAAGKTDI